jgi:hypothetical protein
MINWTLSNHAQLTSIVQDIFYNQHTIFKDSTIENELNMQTRNKEDGIPSYQSFCNGTK